MELNLISRQSITFEEFIIVGHQKRCESDIINLNKAFYHFFCFHVHFGNGINNTKHIFEVFVQQRINVIFTCIPNQWVIFAIWNTQVHQFIATNVDPFRMGTFLHPLAFGYLITFNSANNCTQKFWFVDLVIFRTHKVMIHLFQNEVTGTSFVTSWLNTIFHFPRLQILQTLPLQFNHANWIQTHTWILHQKC